MYTYTRLLQKQREIQNIMKIWKGCKEVGSKKKMGGAVAKIGED